MMSKEEQVIEGISSRHALLPAATTGDPAPVRVGEPKAATSTVSVGAGQALPRPLTGTEPPVDTAKVAALRQAIASGAYKPDPVAIAEQIINYDAGSKSR